MHLKPGEVIVGRRLYRSGQSEYLINGRVARCATFKISSWVLVWVLIPTPSSSRGASDRFSARSRPTAAPSSKKPPESRSSRPSGASLTQNSKSSRLNLSRINDIYVEVEKQLASLKRQASKARRYAEIREQMRALLRQVLASKAKELDHEAERVAGLLGQISQHETQQAQSVNQMESEQERLGARTYELEGELPSAPECARTDGARTGPQ